ncbi:putative lipid II flippase FtsW [Candidatus Chromulinivorax destructor]|uniref:Probable peptidoglycan glycosyltransferase FtsW n=1 Tax=Candidatus Chromulinivorax destructor TaxID=2066483 RepID=A0A345ZAD4_9BACT|nr:putative lipid II flippase FtsW [Candidatus Chromulinivorax destructor]AXK60251.1 putative lipid II flippase FtsW [Candidatus Chromulinivorax destructor]
MLTQQKIKHDATIFISIVLTLITLGIIFVYSSSSFYALEKFGSPLYYAQRQCYGIVLGSLFFYGAYNIPLSSLQSLSFFIFSSSLALTALPLISHLTKRMHGSSRWVNLFGFIFQPSEILKITTIIYVASFLARKQDQRESFKKGYLPLLCISMIVSVILLKQPDFGCTATILATVLIMLFIAKMNMKYLMMLTSVALPLAGIVVYFQPYRWKRILIYLDPWKDPQGAGFQVIQSLIAIGSGGLWGTGIAQSKQKFFYLPMQHTDFIFAIIAEETGFIGTTCLISLFALFLYFGFKISWQLKNLFAIYMVQGLTILVSIQALINIFVSTGLAPTKGIGLPFISYGNTALACNMMIAGLIMNAAHDFYE